MCQLCCKVMAFYEDDEISRICPGKKDCASIRNENGQEVKVQKRLLLVNLKDFFVSV